MPLDENGRTAPLIVAVSLFMENMDSTVIATSLPAIARDIGTNPLALKLAVTSYLLSLAIFIPASGWTADRFGARNELPSRCSSSDRSAARYRIR
jgi:MFS family permease